MMRLPEQDAAPARRSWRSIDSTSGLLGALLDGGLSWRETEHDATLVVISRLRNLARLLKVPGDKYGAARRILRDKIGEHAIHFTGTGLDLGAHDERDEA